MPCGSDEVPHFEITIDDKGEIKLEAHGYTGNSCVKASEKLEAAIGGGKDRTLKAAFYAKVVTPLRLAIGGNGGKR